MTPVDQTRFGRDDGNCFEACVASVLGIGLDDVPDLRAKTARGQNGKLNDFIAPRGLAYVEVSTSLGVYGPTGVVCIVSGPSPRSGGGLNHSCVAETDRYGVRIIYDPHPSRVGLPRGKPTVGFFVALRVPDPVRAGLLAVDEPLDAETGECTLCGAFPLSCGKNPGEHAASCPWRLVRGV